MRKQKRESLMFNKLLRGTLFSVIMALLLSACSVTQEDTPSDANNKISPANIEALSEAISTMKSGDSKKARTQLLELINQQPNISNAHVNLGITFIKDKSFSEAENSFNRALKINPDNIYALNQLGFLHRKQGHFARAKASYEKAIDIKPDYAYAHLNLGILYDLYLYDLEKAIEQYKIYQELSKDEDKQVNKWIFDLERRLKKSLAPK